MAKRKVKNPKTSGAVHKWLSEIAGKGGAAATGEKKKRSPEHYARILALSMAARGVKPKKDATQAASA